MLLLSVQFIFAQAPQPKTINIENADLVEVNEVLVPDGVLLTGNVKVNHDGIVLTCNKAYVFKKENYLKAFGNVQLVQGDTLFLNSKYAEYSGNSKKAFATGDAVMTSPDATLRTDTINFDRNIQQVFYNTKGTIVNKDNTLVSKSGRYFVAEKKFQFLTEVTITNPKYVIKSNHLDYYSNSGHTYLFGPSTITSQANYIYTEKGFYDTKKNLAHFLRRSYIKYDDRLIEGDSLYYNRNIEFASATRNVKITDSINRGIVKGHYAEIYKLKDSMYVTKRAVAINLVEKDSVYIHGQKLMVTGKEGERILRAYKNVRFYKIDMSGKCDSIHSNSKTALTKLIGNPILWNGESQITGDIMHLIGDNTTKKLDSLKVLNNTFIVSRDTLGTGYNQVKGLNLFGKFKEGKLHDVDVIKNTEVVYYMRNDANELIGINKNVSSKINLILENNDIETITFFNKVDGDVYPEADLPENARKLKGLKWRGDERIKSKDDIFTAEDNELNDKLVQEGKDQEAKDKNTPMKVRKETLDYDKKKPAVKTSTTKATTKTKK
ncbi:OstA-like protein [Flavobacterium piscis]|uniref:OstA-like protein n=1 Tax=Flavobacterium piscis TaxID=1114874 RepID=A0ABX2XPM5_9FLAO|nr:MULTISPECIES: OstA-like protein [Flavobacterium]OCB77851.1 OstA-like protein [Flavobacterium piscis]OXE97570.1 OstA-like protein [Flavobacterium piscis]QDW23219.1 OstA-like protein [Flavobacterium sp. KBS0721]